MNTKLTQAIAIFMGLSVFAFALSFFPDAGITGHVLVDSKVQPLDMTITESQSYILSTNVKEPKYITFLRLTGEIIGDGRADVILNNGRGQRLTLYSNDISKTRPNLITGMAVSEFSQGEEDDIILMIPGLTLDYLELFPEINYAKGKFANECKQTCLIEMELSKDTTYHLEFRVSKGTQIKLDNLLYGLRVE